MPKNKTKVADDKVVSKTLYFSNGNAKLGKNVSIFSLPAGFSCPGSHLCQAFSNRLTGKITDGENQQFRCYAASMEAIYPTLRSHLWDNFELIKNCKNKEEITALFERDGPKWGILRIGVSGDYFSQMYFDAIIDLAKRNPALLVYSYTKSLHFWVARLGQIPKNFVLTASRGGKYDYLIEKYKLKEVSVIKDLKTVKSVIQKIQSGKPPKNIDFDDKLAQNPKVKKFKILLHGTQSPKTQSSQSWQLIKKTVGGYS